MPEQTNDALEFVLQTAQSVADENSPDWTKLDFMEMLDEALNVGVAILDKNMIYQYMNQYMYKQLEINPKALRPGDPLTKCHELMLENGMLTKDIIERNKISIEHTARSANGKPYYSRIMQLGNDTYHKLVRIQLENGCTISMSHDVTELFEKDKILNQALTIGSAGYWTYDFKTKSYEFGETLQNLLGPKIIEAITKSSILAACHTDDRAGFKEQFRNLTANNGKIDHVGRFMNRRGVYIWTHTSGIATKNQKGNWSKLQVFVKDITQERLQAIELERAKDEAIAASRAKSEFLANMSHEIRTPMNGILGMAELLARTEIDTRQQEFVKVINKSSSALLTIINDILDFSKIEAGALMLDPVPFNLKDAISDVATLLNCAAQDKGLELVVNYPIALPVGFIGDAGRLRQVLTNLVGNAIKFTSEGHVSIDVDIKMGRNETACINVSVKDTGIGIEPDKLDKVFKKFTQADNSTTRVYGGTGLGLSISKHLIEMMDGRMIVESVFGEGSSFGFTIPLKCAQEIKTEKFTTVTTVGRRALIVDDIEVNRRVLRERLTGWGMTHVEAQDGVEALNILTEAYSNNEKFDVILTDFLMPGMTGKEFAEMVTNHKHLPKIPTLMLSSVDETTSDPSKKLIGIDRYLVKPVREKNLHEALTAVLELAESQKITHEPPLQKLPPLIQSENTPAKPLAAVPPQKPTEVVTPAPSSVAIRPASPLSDITEPSAKIPNNGSKIQILVAEDFPLNRDVIRLMLSDTNYEPTFAENGKLAVDTYAKSPDTFTAIIMDVSMPVMDGYTATAEIRKLQKARNLHPTPIIALTGHALENDRQLCMEAGMDEYLTKPVKQTLLMEMLERFAPLAEHPVKAAS